MSLIFVDCEAGFDSPCPSIGSGLTEFGAVEYESCKAFYGKPNPSESWRDVFERFAEWLSQFKGRPIFVSDNPAYDWQWINHGFHTYLGRNPFGHSARRIGDFYAGVVGDFYKSIEWKRFRITPHDHNPVHDAMGNAEAFAHILTFIRGVSSNNIKENAKRRIKMPFIKPERRQPMLDGTLTNIEPGDRCFKYYHQMITEWRENPKWTTVNKIYKRLISDWPNNLDDRAAKSLAWQVFFVLEVIPYEERKRFENGDI